MENVHKLFYLLPNQIGIFYGLWTQMSFIYLHPRYCISDEDEEPRCIQLTNQHKGAIRAIRKVSRISF